MPPTLPEIIESPAPETITPTPEAQPQVTLTPESTLLPKKIAPDSEKPELKRYFNPRQFPNATPSLGLPATPTPAVPETTPEEK